MNGRFSNAQILPKNGQKSDSFAAHLEQNFKYTTPSMDLRKCMMFKVVKHLNPIGAMESFKNPKFNLCIEEHSMILKNLSYKCVTVMKISLEIYKACQHKTTFHQFSLRTDDPVNR